MSDVGGVRDRDVFGAFHVPFGFAARRVAATTRPDGDGRNARVLFLTVEVRVVRDARAVFGGFGAFGQVVVHDRCSLG